jgi:histone deacetylase complex regulatory component SIN3
MIGLQFQKGIEICGKLLETSDFSEKEALVKRLVKYRILPYIYKAETENVLQVLMGNTEEAAYLVRERLREKLREVEEAKGTHARRWEEEANKNFYRSLDHMSFYFKHFDKKNVTKTMFLKEAVQRKEVMKYLEAMKNNFQEGTRFEKCTVANTEVKTMCPKGFYEKFNSFKSVSKDIKTKEINFCFWEEITQGRQCKVHGFPQFVLSYTNQSVLKDVTGLLEWYKETNRLNEKV